MKYLGTKEISKLWKVSERSVRNYCREGKVEGAVLIGKIWQIPENAVKPKRAYGNNFLDILKEEKNMKYKGGIYHKTQIELTYNSNHIEGSRLTHDQTRHIFETNTIGLDGGTVRVDDIVETVNHFKCVDMVIEGAKRPITQTFIRQLHRTLKSGTTDARKDWFAAGEYKRLPNTVGDMFTTQPEEVEGKMKGLLSEYNDSGEKSFDDLLDFHYKFECIHPFQDGNGRIGRLLLFKECLKHDIVPFIIDEELKLFYYRGLKEWTNERGYLRDTCLMAQDKFRLYLDYFRVPYKII